MTENEIFDPKSNLLYWIKFRLLTNAVDCLDDNAKKSLILLYQRVSSIRRYPHPEAGVLHCVGVMNLFLNVSRRVALDAIDSKFKTDIDTGAREAFYLFAIADQALSEMTMWKTAKWSIEELHDKIYECLCQYDLEKIPAEYLPQKREGVNYLYWRWYSNIALWNARRILRRPIPKDVMIPHYKRIADLVILRIGGNLLVPLQIGAHYLDLPREE